MKLTETKCKNLKPRDKVYRVADGHGLYIEVVPTGSKYWRLSYRFNGKQKRLALGVYPRTALKEARERREQARKSLENSKDPGELKKLAKLELRKKYEDNFEALAREWHKNRSHTWALEHGGNILKRLETYIFPAFGYRPIKEVTPIEVLHAIRKVEAKGNHDLTHRLLQHCSHVFRYGVATGCVDRDITFDLRGALKPGKTKHNPFLSEKELPAFLKDLNDYDTKFNGHTLTKLAFKLLILTFVRSGEIRAAKWDEIDWEKKQWRIPAERMKMKTPHIVPLAEQSIMILKQVKQITGEDFSRYIFPSNATPLNHMSENTFLRAIKIMGYEGVTTGHGFRSTASTILNESALFNSDAIERQLAHAERNQVRAAYNYADYLPERTKMMQWWADYLDNKL